MGLELKIRLDEDAAETVISMMSGLGLETEDVVLIVGNGHAGFGLYVHQVDYPEEGAEFAGRLRGSHMHLARGNEYREVGRGHLQTKEPLGDMAQLVCYVDTTNGSLWFRPPGEFDDAGRFLALPMDPKLQAARADQKGSV